MLNAEAAICGDRIPEKSPIHEFSSAGGMLLDTVTVATNLESVNIPDQGGDLNDVVMNTGFSSAGGKQLASVSKETLAKAETLLRDESNALSSIDKMGDFASAGGKKLVLVSNSARKKAELLLGTENVAPQASEYLSTSNFGGFTSAKGTKLADVSDAAKRKAQSLMDSDTQNMILPDTKSTSRSTGFSFADGKKLACVSDPALEKVTGLFGTGDNQSVTKRNEGYSYVAGKKLAVLSDEAVKKVHSNLDGDSGELSKANVGFSSAGGKKLAAVSTSAQAKANKLLELENLGENKPSEIAAVGFSSAGGKKLAALSASAQAKAKKLLELDTLDEDKPSEIVINGFSSAGGKKLVPISASAQAKAKKLLELEYLDENKPPEQQATNGFSSAAGKKLKPLSKEAVQKAQLLMEKENAPIQQVAKTNESINELVPTRPKLESRPSTEFKVPLPKKSESSRRGSTPIISTARRQFRTPFKNGVPKTLTPNCTPIKAAAPSNVVFHLKSADDRLSLQSLFQRYSLPAIQVHVPPMPFDIENAHHITIDSWSWTHCRDDMVLAGAQPKWLSDEWMRNHYSLILWKLACYSQKLDMLKLSLEQPNMMCEIAWNRDSVLHQILYRYEREFVCAHRSIIRQICEKDEAPSRGMILCVSKITSVVDSKVAANVHSKLWLTDGWYSLPAAIDSVLERAVQRGKIYVGLKLSVFGAQIQNYADATPPLEVPKAASLRIYSNSTFREKWSSKLGLVRARPFTKSLSSVHVGGGTLQALDIVVMRRYEVLYLEKHPDGNKTTRNRHEEDLANARFEKQREVQAQKLFAEYESTNKSGANNDEDLQDVTADIMERLESLVPTRNVSPFAKIKICDYPRNHSDSHSKNATFTIWNPTESFDQLAEGKRFLLYFVSPFGSDLHLHLHSTKKTGWMEQPVKQTLIQSTCFLPRTFANISSIHTSYQAVNELDILVVYLGEVSTKQITSRDNKLVTVTTIAVSDSSGICMIEMFGSQANRCQTLKVGAVTVFQDLAFQCTDQHFNIVILSSTEHSSMTQQMKNRSWNDEWTRLQYFVSSGQARAMLDDRRKEATFLPQWSSSQIKLI